MPFKPGRSGNPSGRTKEDVELRRLARTHARRCLAVQLRLLKSTDERVRLAASDALLNRGFGKPMQAIEHSGEVNHVHVAELTDERLAAIAAGGSVGAAEAQGGPEVTSRPH
jgi:hypothetical protein